MKCSRTCIRCGGLKNYANLYTAFFFYKKRSKLNWKDLFILAIYNWRGETRYGLPLEIGETIQILEECSGWYRGFTTKNRSIKGIFPQNYVVLKPCKVDNEGLFESVLPLEDAVVREVTLVLREWGDIWKRLYVVSIQIRAKHARYIRRQTTQCFILKI